VVLPYTRTGVVGGIMLGLGRALGETMAVTFVIGNMNQLILCRCSRRPTASPRRWPTSLPKPASLHQASLIYLGLVLFFITFVVLAFSKVVAGAAEEAGTRS
jgi:phosphate transport system permease protein